MILTGMALEDFLVWVYYGEDTNQASDESKIEKIIFHANRWVEKQDERFIDTLIIEWFDSVDLHIGYYYTYVKFQTYVNDSNKGKFNSRQEATEQAIIKANEIYNERTNLSNQI